MQGHELGGFCCVGVAKDLNHEASRGLKMYLKLEIYWWAVSIHLVWAEENPRETKMEAV